MIATPRSLRTADREADSRNASRLRFTPFAWRKLLFFRDAGPTDVAAFGLAASDDPLLVEDVALFRQRCTPATVRPLDGRALADYLAERLADGVAPSRATRISIRTTRANREFAQALDVAASPIAERTSWDALLVVSTVGPVVGQLRRGLRRAPLAVSVPDVASESSRVRSAWESDYGRHVVRETLRVGPTGYHLPAHPRTFVPTDRVDLSRVRRSLDRRTNP